MISNELITSFYTIELEGLAVESVIAGDFGINKIAIGSKPFDSDLPAFAALQHALNYIITCPSMDLDKAEETIEYNPEFFPSLPPLIPTAEHIAAQAEAEEALAALIETLPESSGIPIIMTKVFDPMGDFIESRWQLLANDYKIIGKVGIDPKQYINHKAKQLVAAEQPKDNRTIH